MNERPNERRMLIIENDVYEQKPGQKITNTTLLVYEWTDERLLLFVNMLKHWIR